MATRADAQELVALRKLIFDAFGPVLAGLLQRFVALINDNRDAIGRFFSGIANAVGPAEARELYDTFAVPASGAPLFQAALANINPWTEVKVATKGADG